ncbi:3'(2'),5'-bisphosphate nucleotidase CysQ [Spiribacter vilamensis]|uniref:3'(2'),5'-bisphosphate nucleotidase CysQ n=1 Tax=Spiribacter vilamensis TaxID=531306 RepID=A0A4V2GJB1_9GAMM|nr:3'(2'),5'-bisphosphate nucleotidase CysQ [Spiribacter vilamensis]RZU99565.1 3'(2'),5'-bisphosphate nucleotidase [Spiribacter vilamensis]TVO61468.1 3'(2'),5'-bisphosphate nucleotidase CysQ [Spiribacter vilamensis]
MDNNDLFELAENAVVIARAAGRSILEIYAAGYEVESKADDSPLTTADNAAHRLIADRLQALTPDIPVLSEEGGLPDYAERQGWTTYWLVDPLDGTREFVKRNGEFTVNIALVEAGQPVIGVVHAPVLDCTWEAVHRPGDGADSEVALGRARRHDSTGTRDIQTRRAPSTDLTLVVSRSHRHPQVETLLQRLPAYQTRSMGSSMKFCLVAEGEADCYPRFGPTSEWDSAAAQCIVEAAGGAVIRPDGEALRYNTKESTLNPNFVVVGDPAWPWREALEGLPVEER